MSKFNSTAQNKRKTTNEAGGVAYTTNDGNLELYNIACSFVLENTYYKKSYERLEELKSALRRADPVFAMKLAIYIREEMYMRTVPVIIVVELAKIVSELQRKNKSNRYLGNLLALTVTRIIGRADEITEILSYYSVANDWPKGKIGKLSHAIRNGIAEAFTKFDAYQFGKYRGEGKEFSMSRAIRLIRPRPKTDEMASLFYHIRFGNLRADTHESRRSVAGQSDTDTKGDWEDLIQNHKLGYMALLRNLIAIVEANVNDETFTMVRDYLTNANAIKKSKQFPYRFYSAYTMVVNKLKKRPDDWKQSERYNALLSDLENAVKISIANMPILNGKTALAADVSGSMYDAISGMSMINRVDLSLLFLLLAKEANPEALSMVFGTHAAKIDGVGPVLSSVRSMQSDGSFNGIGHSTNAHLIFEELIDRNIKMDRVLIFTDMEFWNSGSHFSYYSGILTFRKLWLKYKKINPEASLYIFNLAGTSKYPIDIDVDNDVYSISGWSDKVFDMFEMIEKKGEFLEMIERIQIK